MTLFNVRVTGGRIPILAGEAAALVWLCRSLFTAANGAMQLHWHRPHTSIGKRPPIARFLAETGNLSLMHS